MRVYRVREVRKYTGLTRKQIFDYEKSIPPIGTENDAGYKLYDQEGLEKLSLAALLAELGAGPQRINDIFGADNYDSRKVLDDLIKEAKQKMDYLEDIITVAEHVKRYDLSKIGFNFLQLIDLHQTAVGIREIEKSQKYINWLNQLDDSEIDELIDIYKSFEKYRNGVVPIEKLEIDINALSKFATDKLGIMNPKRFIYYQTLMLSMVDSFKEYVDRETRDGLSEIVVGALNTYLMSQMGKALAEIEWSKESWDALCAEQYDAKCVKELINKISTSLQDYLGLEDESELIIFIEGLKIGIEQRDDEIDEEEVKEIVEYWTMVINALKHYKANKPQDEQS